jgi:hypothetical protein
MGHLYVYRKKSKNHHKTISKYKYTNIIQNHKHDKKLSKINKHILMKVAFTN